MHKVYETSWILNSVAKEALIIVGPVGVREGTFYDTTLFFLSLLLRFDVSRDGMIAFYSWI